MKESGDTRNNLARFQLDGLVLHKKVVLGIAKEKPNDPLER
jgi:hypothetical protein